MGQLAGNLAGGGGAAAIPSVSPSSSSANTSPQSAAGSILLDFGGINLGNQDIPLNTATTSSSNNPPTVGTVASSTLSAVDTYLPLLLVIGAVIALAVWAKGKL